MSTEWGIFNDESEDYTEANSVVAGFWSREEAEQFLAQNADEYEGCEVHECEEPEEEES